MAQLAGFALRIVIAEDLVQLLDAGKRGVQTSLRGLFVGAKTMISNVEPMPGRDSR